MNLGAFFKTVGAQVKAETRINFWGASLINLTITPIIVIAVSAWLDDTIVEQIQMTMGEYLIISMIGGLAIMNVIQLSSEMMADRASGVLLRARSLPNGPLAWSVGKSISTALIILAMQVLLLIAAFIFFDFASLGIGKIVLILLIMFFAIAAHAPLGLIMGVLNRGLYAGLLIMGFVLAVFATSGVAFPIDIMPRWVQVIQLGLPTYWSGHLARWAVLPTELGANEIVGGFEPLMATGILALWIAVGFIVATLLIKRFFRDESIGTLQKLQASIRSQMGV